jgi:multiple sugar transport system ATP-binding protein
MNLINGTMRAAGAQRRVETDDGVALPLPANAPGADGQRVIYGLRPDHLRVANGAGVEAVVDVVEPTGADTLVFARVGKQSICGAFAERHSFKPGQTIALEPLLASIHLFDAQSGNNLRA